MKNENQITFKARSYILTIKYEDIANSEDLINRVLKISKDVVIRGQVEIGNETNYRHYQVFIKFKNQQHFTSIKRQFPTAHIEKCKSDYYASKYVMKKETRDPTFKPIEYGYLDIKKPLSNKKMTLNDALNLIYEEDKKPLDLVLENPHLIRFKSQMIDYFNLVQNQKANNKIRQKPLDVYYVYGISGIGKTYSILNKYNNDIFRVTSYKNGCFDNYNNEKILLLDEFVWSELSNFTLTDILNLIDPYYFYELPCRYINKILLAEKIFIVSNLRLLEQFENEAEIRKNAFRRRITKDFSIETKEELKSFQEFLTNT